MKFVIDKAIPFIEGVLEPYGEVCYLDGPAIGPADIKDADALLIRTRTRCTSDLLEGSNVRIIATATIGSGVMNYVLSAIYGTASRRRIRLEGSKVGIIGVGNVGSRVASALRLLGLDVLLCDPPRAEAEGPALFCDLDFLLRNSDIVTLHVPLNPTTRKMADAAFFSKMKLGAFFINASRGEIVNEEDLLAALPKLGPVILDTWCNEPHINKELASKVDIATPHIAGYSYQGKLLGTSMTVRSVARYFGIKDLFEFFPNPGDEPKDAVKLDLRGLSEGQIASTLQYNYPIFTDDFMFRVHPDEFESLRENYRYRREFFID